jgi:hypothetical protein
MLTRIFAMFAWRTVWESDFWRYQENSVTGARRALRYRQGCHQPVAFGWLRGGRVIG